MPKCAKLYRDKEKLKVYLKKNKEKYYNRDIDDFNSHKKWTDEEINILINSNDVVYNIAKKLNRSMSSVIAKRSKVLKEKNMDLEIGNLAFNTNKNQLYKCPDFIIALLRDIDRELKLTMFMVNHSDYESPFDNTGNVFMDLKDIFEVQAYNWNENESQDYNFIFKTSNKGNIGDIKISWYKYLGRDTTINVDIKGSEKVILDLYENCLKALRQYRNENSFIRNNISEIHTGSSEWETGNCIDNDILFLNLKGINDIKYSRLHISIDDAQKLINDIGTITLNSYFNEKPIKIIRTKLKEIDKDE